MTKVCAIEDCNGSCMDNWEICESCAIDMGYSEEDLAYLCPNCGVEIWKGETIIKTPEGDVHSSCDPVAVKRFHKMNDKVKKP